MLATWAKGGKELGEQRLYSTELRDAAQARRKVMVCGENPTVILMYEVKHQAVAVTMKAL